MRDTLQLLQKRLTQGFCLHGSQKRIELLEPRQANCESGRAAGCQKAVYASRDCVRVPCIKGMISPIDPKKGYGSSYTGSTSGVLVVTGENVRFTPAYVHILPCDSFQELDDEFVSFEPVRAHEIVLVTPEILRLFPDLDLRISI